MGAGDRIPLVVGMERASAGDNGALVIKVERPARKRGAAAIDSTIVRVANWPVLDTPTRKVNRCLNRFAAAAISRKSRVAFGSRTIILDSSMDESWPARLWNAREVVSGVVRWRRWPDDPSHPWPVPVIDEHGDAPRWEFAA